MRCSASASSRRRSPWFGSWLRRTRSGPSSSGCARPPIELPDALVAELVLEVLEDRLEGDVWHRIDPAAQLPSRFVHGDRLPAPHPMYCTHPIVMPIATSPSNSKG